VHTIRTSLLHPIKLEVFKVDLRIFLADSTSAQAAQLLLSLLLTTHPLYILYLKNTYDPLVVPSPIFGPLRLLVIVAISLYLLCLSFLIDLVKFTPGPRGIRRTVCLMVALLSPHTGESLLSTLLLWIHNSATRQVLSTNQQMPREPVDGRPGTVLLVAAAESVFVRPGCR
jgi:hypothetical protein